MFTRQLLVRSRAARTYAPTKTFSTATQRWAGKEDKLHHEGRAEEIEKEKHASLQQQKEGKGQWNEDLGSSSESIIKAERGETKSTHDTIKDLQEEAKKVAGK